MDSLYFAYHFATAIQALQSIAETALKNGADDVLKYLFAIILSACSVLGIFAIKTMENMPKEM